MTLSSTRKINVPAGASLNKDEYRAFLEDSASLIASHAQYFSPDEGGDSLELAHMIPSIPETVICLYLGINEAVCNKALVTPFLVHHAHKNVFAFDPDVYPGGKDVPDGTVDTRDTLPGFQPPNKSWPEHWTYVMINENDCGYRDLWETRGYIDMIAAKFEDFTVLSSPQESRICFFIDEKAFDHPVNKGRYYLISARKKGDASAHEFKVPEGMEGETKGLVPVILEQGEKIYVATADFSPCPHAWSNIHDENEHFAVVNENSAVPLDLIVRKPVVKKTYASKLIPAKGSADNTTDWFLRGRKIVRTPLLEGLFKG